MVIVCVSVETVSDDGVIVAILGVGNADVACGVTVLGCIEGTIGNVDPAVVVEGCVTGTDGCGVATGLGADATILTLAKLDVPLPLTTRICSWSGSVPGITVSRICVGLTTWNPWRGKRH